MNENIIQPLIKLNFGQRLIIDKKTIPCSRGNAEGSILSPKLWNLYVADLGFEL